MTTASGCVCEPRRQSCCLCGSPATSSYGTTWHLVRVVTLVCLWPLGASFCWAGGRDTSGDTFTITFFAAPARVQVYAAAGRHRVVARLDTYPTVCADLIHRSPPVRLTSIPPSPSLQKSESRRRQSVDLALHDAEAKLRELIRRRDEADAAAAAAAAPTERTEAESEADATVVAELRGQVSRARERAEMLEERLCEADRAIRRLEREAAEAVELGVSERENTLQPRSLGASS